MNLPIFKELLNSDYIILFPEKTMSILCNLNTGLLWQKTLRVKPMESCVTCCELSKRADSSLCCSDTQNISTMSSNLVALEKLNCYTCVSLK